MEMVSDERFLVSGWEDDLLDIDETRNPKDITENKILQACEKGDLKEVMSLIEKNPDLINVSDKDKYTPLHRACYSNNVEIVKYLIQNGANVDAKTEMQWEPLHSCCQWNHKECAAILIQNGANINATSEGNQTPLHIAASHGASCDTVQLLLMHPFIDPTIKNNSGETAAEIARRSSRYYNVFDMINPLLDTKNLRESWWDGWLMTGWGLYFPTLLRRRTEPMRKVEQILAKVGEYAWEYVTSAEAWVSSSGRDHNILHN